MRPTLRAGNSSTAMTVLPGPTVIQAAPDPLVIRVREQEVIVT